MGMATKGDVCGIKSGLEGETNTGLNDVAWTYRTFPPSLYLAFTDMAFALLPVFFSCGTLQGAGEDQSKDLTSSCSTL